MVKINGTEVCFVRPDNATMIADLGTLVMALHNTGVSTTEILKTVNNAMTLDGNGVKKGLKVVMDWSEE